jgi:hypothetical protein
MSEYEGYGLVIAWSMFDVAHFRLHALEQIGHPLCDLTSEPHNSFHDGRCLSGQKTEGGTQTC